MARRKHKRMVQQADLDITAFMNLMIVLVPVLLLSMVFSQTAVLDLNFPADSEELQQIDPEDEFQLQLILRADSLSVASSKSGLLTRIPRDQESYDFEALSRFLQNVKQRS